MNEKTLNIYLPETQIEIPLYVSGFTQSGTWRARFEGATSLNYVSGSPTGNLVPNPGFESAFTSASTATNWILDSGWQNVRRKGSPATIHAICMDTSAVGTALAPGGSVIGITSGSFRITPNASYKCSFYVYSKDGTMRYAGPEEEVTQSFSASYTGSIRWYTSASAFLSENIIGEGNTSTDVINSETEISYPAWKKHERIFIAPPTTASAVLSIRASTPMPSSIDPMVGEILYAFPVNIYIDSTSVMGLINSLIYVNPSGSLSMTDTFRVSPPMTNLVTNTYIFSASSVGGVLTDCWGRKVDSYFNTAGEKLYIGNDGVGECQSFIPFSIDFTGITTGIHVVSACLVVTAATSNTNPADKHCYINAGFENAVNPTMPGNWSAISGKNMTPTITSASIPEGWMEGDQYTFDITQSAREIFGANMVSGVSTEGITWNNSASAAILLRDKGSSPGEYRSIVSTKHSISALPRAKLKIEIAPNFYSGCVVDTFIDSNTDKKAKVFYNSDLWIGAGASGSARGLIRFDTSTIPAGATVSSASLCLYHISSAASSDSYLACHNMLKQWDTCTASWEKQYGTHNWDGGEGGGAGTDYTSASSGSKILLASLAANTWVDMPLTPALVQGWVTTPSSNLGVMVKSRNEYLDSHKFASSDNATISLRPYLHVEYNDGTSKTKDIREGGASSGGGISEGGGSGTVHEHSVLYDSYIDNVEESHNFGATSELKLRATSADISDHALLWFNQTGASINTLSYTGNYFKIYCNYFQGITATTFSVHRILKTWMEGASGDIIVNGEIIGQRGVTWRYASYPNSDNWAAEGMKADVDYASAELGTGIVTGTGWVNINLTNYEELKKLVGIPGVTTNYGIVLRYLSGGKELREFNSRHAATNQPKLYLYY